MIDVYEFLFLIFDYQEKCGKTSETTGTVGNLNCDENKCHCYGDLCLVKKLADDRCSNGKVYRSGTPVCNKQWGKQGGDVVCKALGFDGQESIKRETKR